MLPSYLFTLIAIAGFSFVARAQDTRLFGDADKRAIEQLYDRYGQAFIMKDYNALRECVQAPFVLFADELRTLKSVEAVLAMYQTLREALDQRGYGYSVVVETHIIPLTADSALINAAFRRYKKDGSLLEEGAAIYAVYKSSGTWKLRGAGRQHLQYFGKTY